MMNWILSEATKPITFLQPVQIFESQSSCVGLEVKGNEGNIPASEPDGGRSPLVASLVDAGGPR
eukprot:16287149-Heterocapsa_arctica.AAC.1